MSGLEVSPYMPNSSEYTSGIEEHINLIQPSLVQIAKLAKKMKYPEVSLVFNEPGIQFYMALRIDGLNREPGHVQATLRSTLVDMVGIPSTDNRLEAAISLLSNVIKTAVEDERRIIANKLANVIADLALQQ